MDQIWCVSTKEAKNSILIVRLREGLRVPMSGLLVPAFFDISFDFSDQVLVGFFPVKGQIVNIFKFVGHLVSFGISRLCPCS